MKKSTKRKPFRLYFCIWASSFINKAVPKHSGRVIQSFILPANLPKWPESSMEGTGFEKCSYYTIIPYTSRYNLLFRFIVSENSGGEVMFPHKLITILHQNSYQYSVQCNYQLTSFGENILLENAQYVLGPHLSSSQNSHWLTGILWIFLAFSLQFIISEKFLSCSVLQVLNIECNITIFLTFVPVDKTPQSLLIFRVFLLGFFFWFGFQYQCCSFF